jgi:hypothetical protein
MSETEYGSLAFDERAAILFDIGTYLEDVDYYNQTVVLYSVYSFFVEVYYSSESNEIVKMDVAGEEALQKYLGRIDVKLL